MPSNGKGNRPVRSDINRKPAAGTHNANAHRRPRRPKTTDELMQENFLKYKQSQRTRKKAKKIALTVICVTLAVCIMVIAGMSCSSSGKKDNSAAPAQASANSETLKPANEESSKAEESQDPETSEEVITGVSPDEHQYTNNKTRFSSDVMSMLNKSITSEYAALYDVTADEILFGHNSRKKCYPASTTKLLTAITASSIIDDPEKVITVGDEIKLVKEESSVARLEVGMQLTFEMLMDALLLPSGNDAAYTLAVTCGRIKSGDEKLSNEKAVKVFMEQMNKTAADIGAAHTHFTTPDGWHEDAHYTCAEDLVKISDHAIAVPIIRRSCSKQYAEWELINGGTIAWQNTNKLILPDSDVYSRYCNGLKTGFTDEAGSSVIASATIEGHTFIVVAMDGKTVYDKYYDCNRLFEEGFKLYGLKYRAKKSDDDEVEDEESSDTDESGKSEVSSNSDGSEENGSSEATE